MLSQEEPGENSGGHSEDLQGSQVETDSCLTDSGESINSGAGGKRAREVVRHVGKLDSVLLSYNIKFHQGASI